MRKWFSIQGNELNVFKLHILFSIMQGVIAGIFAFNELIFIKSMSGSEFQLSILLQLSAVVLIVSIVVNEFLRRIKDKRKMLIITAFITHAPFFLLLFFPNTNAKYLDNEFYHYTFLLVFLFYYLSLIVILPTINQVLKHNYSHKNFGKLYGYSSTINKIVMIFCTFAFGFILDKYNYSFTFVYPFVAVLGIISIILLTQIPQPENEIVKVSFWKSTKSAFASTKEILFSNKAFLHFEVGFMIYGAASMIIATIIPIYFNEVFKMNYSTFGFYKNGYNILAILLLPFFGKLIGKIDTRLFSAITFAAIMFFTLFLALAEYFPAHITFGNITIYYTIFTAYFFYGIFAATMALVWFVGSAYFCKNEDASRYQSIHLSLTGVRAAFSFQIGVWMYIAFGFTFVFVFSTIMLLVSVLVMIWSYKKDKKILQKTTNTIPIN